MVSTANEYNDIGVDKHCHPWGDGITCSFNVIPKINDVVEEDDLDYTTNKSKLMIEELVSVLDVTPILPELRKFYSEDYRYKYPIDAMFKAIIYYKLKGYKFFTSLSNELLSSMTLQNSLGFDDNYKPPSYKTLYHFMHIRLGEEGTIRLFRSILKENVRLCAVNGINLGEEYALDATPINSKKTDPDAEWNHHYEIKGYLWHNMRCMKTMLPMFYHVEHGKSHEGKYLIKGTRWFIENARITPKVAVVDGGYIAFKNIARLKMYWNIDMISQIQKTWALYDKIDEAYFKKHYQKYWNRYDFDENADLIKMMKYLYKKEKRRKDDIGKYFRNQMMRKYEEDPGKYLKQYHRRSKIEGRHGVEKRMFTIKYIEARGIKKIRTHIGFHVIALHALALTRLQHGITQGLINIEGLV